MPLEKVILHFYEKFWHFPQEWGDTRHSSMQIMLETNAIYGATRWITSSVILNHLNNALTRWPTTKNLSAVKYDQKQQQNPTMCQSHPSAVHSLLVKRFVSRKETFLTHRCFRQRLPCSVIFFSFSFKFYFPVIWLDWRRLVHRLPSLLWEAKGQSRLKKQQHWLLNCLSWLMDTEDLACAKTC